MITRDLQKYKTVQEIAKDTIGFLKSFIREGVTEKKIAEAAEKYMKQRGVKSFWYHGVGAFVFVGERTTLSISGREYGATDAKVKSEDLVTVDLSPEIGGIWGDFARTFVVSKGKVAGTKENELEGCLLNFIEGIRTEETLHREFQKLITEEMSFDEAHAKMDSLIGNLGYENMDFKKNLGHIMKKYQDDRAYIEAGNTRKFREAELFTFEPHIKKKDGKYGFKREDIYYFENGRLNIL